MQNDAVWRIISVVCGLLAGGAVFLAGVEGLERSPAPPVLTVMGLGSVVIGVVVASYVGGLRR